MDPASTHKQEGRISEGGTPLQAKVWTGAAIVLVTVSGILGSASHPYSAPPATTSGFLSQQQLIADIQKQQLQQSKVAQNIRVIHMGEVGSEGFAFATFDVDGQQEYASLLTSPQGYVMSTYTMGTDQAVPIQYNALAGDGFEYVTGGVFRHPDVKNAVLIWSDGTAVAVPVQNGYFWYEHKVQMSARTHVQRVMGITSSGGVIQSPGPAG